MMIRRIAVLGDDNKNYENNDNDNDIKYNYYEILYEFASPIFFDFFPAIFSWRLSTAQEC